MIRFYNPNRRTMTQNQIDRFKAIMGNRKERTIAQIKDADPEFASMNRGELMQLAREAGFKSKGN